MNRILFILLLLCSSPLLQANKVVYNDSMEFTLLGVNSDKIKIDNSEIYHSVSAVVSDGQYVAIENDFTWSVDYWYQSTAKAWDTGDKVKVFYDNGTWELENVTKGNSVWGSFAGFERYKLERIKSIRNDFTLIELNDGKQFETYSLSIVNSSGFQAGDLVFWMHNKGSSTHKYALWDLNRGSIIFNLKYMGKNQGGGNSGKPAFDLSNILTLEKRLNSQVKGQPEAVKTVCDALMRFSLNLNDPQKPIGVFLFVGPTGVGKTELCKAIARELLKSESEIIRFNMADFNSRHDVWRLIGVSPGYVNHEDGGQLTEGIRHKPNAIILLDEMEKADPEIQKLFLSAFDEGFIVNADGERIDCSKCLFVMTSNLCAKDILNMSLSGRSSEEILNKIEPTLMRGLSPELYNRLQPVVFHAITPEVLDDLVHLLLNKVVKNFKEKRNIILHIDPSVAEYLLKNGYSAELGVRPLKALIEKKVVGYLSQAITSEEIPNGSTMWIAYDAENYDWIIEWE